MMQRLSIALQNLDVVGALERSRIGDMASAHGAAHLIHVLITSVVHPLGETAQEVRHVARAAAQQG